MLRNRWPLWLALAALLAIVPHTAAQTAPGGGMEGAPGAGDVIAPKGHAGISLALRDGRLSLAPGSALRMADITPARLTATLTRGELFLDLAALPDGVSVILRTPRGDVVVQAAGAYEVIAGDHGAPAVVAVIEGAARAGDTDIAAGREAVLLGGDPARIALQPLHRDDFADEMLSGRAPRAVAAAPPMPKSDDPNVQNLWLGDPGGSWAGAPRAAHGPFWFPDGGPRWEQLAPGRSFTTATQGDEGLDITRYTKLTGPPAAAPADANPAFAQPNKIQGFQAGTSP